MKHILKYFFIFTLIFLLVQKRPVCYYPETIPNVREAQLSDIELRVNKLDSGQDLWLYHTGSSMYPTIKDGQVCSCIQDEKYNKGDIVSFYQLENNNEVTFISHRVEDISPYGYITKGDNNIYIDYTTVPKENVFCEIEQKSGFQMLIDKVKGQ
jgi:signal peptidase I